MRAWAVSNTDPAIARGIAESEGLPVILAGVLAARGMIAGGAVLEFLSPTRELIEVNRFLPSATPIAERILDAAAKNVPVLVYGDYDVDGISAAYILGNTLKSLRIKSNIYLPSRFGEGYGLSAAALEKAKEQGYGLVVTVDCGIGAPDEILRAGEIGIGVIVTDHHTPPSVLPDTLICNPLTDGHFTETGYDNISGAAVAFAVAKELYRMRGLDLEQLNGRFLEFVALATIADSMKVSGVNRSLVREGLDQMWDTVNLGLAALLDATGISAGVRPTTEQLQFNVIPALNACGRMDSPRLALGLFAATNADEAKRLAAGIKALNGERQLVQERVFKEAARQAADAGDCPALVLYDESWHPGILGIVASQVAELFGKHTVVLSSAHGDDGTIRGSARASGRADIRQCLEAAEKHLIKFGGHPAAAGVVLAKESLDEFRSAFLMAAAELPATAGDAPTRTADIEAGVSDIAGLPESELSRLEPFGEGNPPPLVSIPFCRIEGVRTVGRQNTTLLGRLSDDKAQARFVAFRMSHLFDRLMPDVRFTALVELAPSVFNGKRETRIRLIDVEEVKRDDFPL